MQAATAKLPTFTTPDLFTDAHDEAKPKRYDPTRLKIIQWRWREAEDIPAGFNRDLYIKNAETLYNQYRFLFEGLTSERFVVFLLNSQNKVQAVEIVTEGTLNASLVHPREVFKAAVRGIAAAIIIAHNHPSGNPEPSAEDCQITRQLVEAGKIMGIQVHDHVIFRGTGYTSMAERGMM